MNQVVADITIPDSAIAREAAEHVRTQSGEILFNHSSRVFLFGVLKGRARGLSADLEGLYVAALFHDLGLTAAFGRSQQRFELDGANFANDFLLARGYSTEQARMAWLSIALHTTPEVPSAMEPGIALVTAGVEADVLGFQLDEISGRDRTAVVAAFPRPNFKENILQAFYGGMKHRPDSTFGTTNDDVLAHFDPQFQRKDFVQIIQESDWEA